MALHYRNDTSWPEQQLLSGRFESSQVLRNLELSTHTATYMYIYREAYFNSRLQYSRIWSTCVIAQQYSSTTFVSLRFRSRKKIFGAFQIFFFFTLSKFHLVWGCVNWNCLSRSTSGVVFFLLWGEIMVDCCKDGSELSSLMNCE